MSSSISPTTSQAFILSSATHDESSTPPATLGKFIETLDSSVFNKYKGLSDEQKAAAFADEMINMIGTPDLTADQKIEFLENVFKKLDGLNDELRAESGSASSEVKELFENALPIIEGRFLAHIDKNLYNRPKELNDQIIEKVTRAGFSRDEVTAWIETD